MRKHKAVITNNQGQTEKIEVEIIHLSARARFVKSLQLFFGFLFLATVSIFIPVMHFVLVPVLVLTAIIVPILNLNKDRAITAQKIPCPKCRAGIAFKPKAFTSEVKNFCTSCHSQVKIVIKS